MACISALLYAAPHLWWGMGISVAFPGDFKSFPDNFWSIAIGFWVMGFLAVLAALFALSFIQPWGRYSSLNATNTRLDCISRVDILGSRFFLSKVFYRNWSCDIFLTVYVSRFKYTTYNLGLHLVFIILSLGYLARSYRPSVSKKNSCTE